jgi:hypothetical protein
MSKKDKQLLVWIGIGAAALFLTKRALAAHGGGNYAYSSSGGGIDAPRSNTIQIAPNRGGGLSQQEVSDIYASMLRSAMNESGGNMLVAQALAAQYTQKYIGILNGQTGADVNLYSR